MPVIPLEHAVACPSAREIRSAELAGLSGLDQTLLRLVALAGCGRISAIVGAERIAPDRDPFIIALNHNTCLEALFVPALLMLLRGGRRIHFLADWNYRMIPGVDLIYRRSGVITVPNKPARPRFLNVLKPLFVDGTPPMRRARERLRDGASIGIFPEGKVNRDPRYLLRGRLGTARLSIETGVPIVPAGLRMQSRASASFGSLAAGSMDVVIGAPLNPPPSERACSAHDVLEWHTRIMSVIGELCGKSPSRRFTENSHENAWSDTNEARAFRA